MLEYTQVEGARTCTLNERFDISNSKGREGETKTESVRECDAERKLYMFVYIL